MGLRSASLKPEIPFPGRSIHLIRRREYPVPVDAIAHITVFGGKPDKERLSDDVVMRYKSPGARVL